MEAKIAVATVSGKAYYQLLKELKRKNMPFLSLKPWDSIPLNVKVVVTTKEERYLVAHPNVLTFDCKSTPTSVIDQAILAVHGKRSYDKVVFGVDPGKAYGVAVLGDDSVLETFSCLSSEETVKAIEGILKRVPAICSVVKVGDGAPVYSKELVSLVDEALPKETVIEVVSEVGTSRFTNEDVHRESKDELSAIEIAGRKGRILPRKKKQ